MDLLQTVRKEGSRGGVNFSWDDVKSSNHRENYLGHSLMAPVGRWQKGKDLNWYAKAEDAELTPEERKEKEELERKEERRKIKEAEEDAMARALGLPVPDRSNANMEPLGLSKEAGKALKEALADDGEEGSGGEEEGKRGLGDGGRRDQRRHSERHEERASKRRRRSRSRSINRDRERRHKHRHHERSRSRDRRRPLRSRERQREEDRPRRERDDSHHRRDRDRSSDRRRRRSRSRSRSPYRRRGHDDER